MGEVIYLMVRIDKVIPVKLLPVLDWCFYSFDLLNRPVPNLELDVRMVGNQLWAIFFRKVSYIKRTEKTILDVDDQSLKQALASLGSESSPQEFREEAYLLFRLSAIEESEDQIRRDANLSFFYATNLYRIDPHLDPGNSPSFTSFVIDRVCWGVVQSHSDPDPKPKESEEELTKDFGPFLKPTGGPDENRS